MDDIEKLAQEFEAQDNTAEQSVEIIHENEEEALPVAMTEQPKEIIEQVPASAPVGNFSSVVEGVGQDILGEARKKITDPKVINKHAEQLKDIADKSLDVQAETASLVVQQQDADNKVKKQEIKNRLIVLKAEAGRLEKEQKQLDKEQKAEHKAKNKQAKWELYKDKLSKMGYTYVPNVVILAMLLFFDGVKSFFDGLGTVSTAIVKACKWLFLIGAILIVLFSIPITREWIINLLSGGT